MRAKAVLISDVHFNLANLEVASEALTLAIKHACSLLVPLVIAGDLHDSKAALRGECTNRLISIFKQAQTHLQIYLIPGNHCLLNEKGDEHALNFLEPYCTLLDGVCYIPDLDVTAIPYQNSVEKVRSILSKIKKGSTLIMHQGILGAKMGEYIKDTSSIPVEELKNFRVITGHYHLHQNIGTATYIGSPYTTSFAEANDGPKGFCVLYDDGTLKQVPTNLRKHVILNVTAAGLNDSELPKFNDTDKVWIKVTGTRLELDKINKKQVAALTGLTNFKLDKIATDSESPKAAQVENKTGEQMLDMIIDASDEDAASKKSLKALWRGLVNAES